MHRKSSAIERSALYGVGVARRKFRFGFAITEGANAGLRCGGWRVWTHGDDAYVTATTFVGRLKVSMHGDAAWQLAYTTEHARSESSLVPDGHDRVMWQFEPTPFENGLRLAFAIGVTRGSLRPADPEAAPDPDTVVVEDRWDLLTVAQIWMTEPGVMLENNLAHIGPPLPLRSGRHVWVTASWEKVPPIKPERIPDAAIMTIVRPEETDVRSPGVMMVGANWSS